MPELPLRKLLDRLRDDLRTRHYSIRTEATYADWVRRFVLFHDIGIAPELLRHADMSTTMIYTHVLNKGGRGVLSPLDAL